MNTNVLHICNNILVWLSMKYHLGFVWIVSGLTNSTNQYRQQTTSYERQQTTSWEH